MMDKIHVVLVLVVSFLIAAVAAGAIRARAPEEPPEDTRPGRAEYVEMGCHQCHGYEGQGARGTGPRLAPEPLPFDMFSNWVRHPPDVMPPYSPNVLDENKLKRMHEYLDSIPPPPDVSSLEAFFEN